MIFCPDPLKPFRCEPCRNQLCRSLHYSSAAQGRRLEINLHTILKPVLGVDTVSGRTDREVLTFSEIAGISASATLLDTCDKYLCEAAFPVLMGEAAPAQAEMHDATFTRRRFDRRVLLLFAVMGGISVAGSAVTYPFVEGATIYDLLSIILSGLTASFLIVGIPAYYWNRKSSLTPRRRILKWMAMSSIIITAVFLIVLILSTIYAPDLIQLDENYSTGDLFLIGLVLSIPLFVVFLIVCMAAFLVAFGVIGVMSALERMIVPWALKQISRLSEVEKPSLVDRAIRWMFDIPSVLETRTLSLHPAKPRTWISRSDLRAPVLWQLLFGFVLGIYISFNPFMSDRSPTALLGLFSLLTSASVLFPFMILPWFLFRRLGAGIKGQAKQFTLYSGIRSRVFQSYFAVGTILILFRLSLQEIAVAFETYFVGFAAFMIVLSGSSFLSTFVYFNYFENGLAEDVTDDLRETEVEVVDSS